MKTAITIRNSEQNVSNFYHFCFFWSVYSDVQGCFLKNDDDYHYLTLFFPLWSVVHYSEEITKTASNRKQIAKEIFLDKEASSLYGHVKLNCNINSVKGIQIHRTGAPLQQSYLRPHNVIC
jgi:hypothetical protein